jgi:hypothetical protein
MFLTTTPQTLGRSVAPRASRLHKLLAPALAACFAATAASAYAQDVPPASTFTPLVARQPATSALERALLPVKYLPQHNPRPAPPPNRTSTTKPPPHHA